MAIQQINLGSAPLGADGDTQRVANTKINQNFSNQTHAASRLVATTVGIRQQPENDKVVTWVGKSIGGYGLGGQADIIGKARNLWLNQKDLATGFYFAPTDYFTNSDSEAGVGANLPVSTHSYIITINSDISKGQLAQICMPWTGGGFYYRATNATFSGDSWVRVYDTKNVTKDGNGFLKAASPVVDLYDDHIDLNGDAKEQGIEFIKNGTGDYTLKTKTGLRSDNTWQIEVPQDNNKNPLFAVDIDAQDDGTINIKCYKRIFSMETFLFGPDFDAPVDINEGRFISVRLNDNPEEQLDEPIE